MFSLAMIALFAAVAPVEEVKEEDLQVSEIILDCEDSLEEIVLEEGQEELTEEAIVAFEQE